MNNAKIFEIKRFAVHDGDGIRTTVFFKGCPLKCVWCHNPEGIDFHPQISYYENKCIGCGECASVCEHSAHHMVDDIHILDREQCTACGKCAEVCLGEALKFYGKTMTVDELMPLIMEDLEFYENSGGGVTLSGGECLMQADFCAELLKKLRKKGVHTAVDTCGFVPKSAIDKVIPFTNIFLYDIKAFDEDVHIQCTGYSNRQILENLQYLDSCGKKIEIRIPYVPGMNDDQLPKIASFLSTLQNITKVKILPYHNYAGSKYKSLDMENTLPQIVPSDEEIKAAEKFFKKYNP